MGDVLWDMPWHMEATSYGDLNIRHMGIFFITHIKCSTLSFDMCNKKNPHMSDV
jgi:hypothetical protein